MSNLVKFEEKLLTHYLQCADFASVLLGCKVDLSIAPLAHLGKNLEVAVAQPCAALSQICSLSAQVFMTCYFILFHRSFRGSGKLGIEQSFAALAMVDIAEEVEIMVKEVCQVLADGANLEEHSLT